MAFNDCQVQAAMNVIEAAARFTTATAVTGALSPSLNNTKLPKVEISPPAQ